MNRLLQGDVGSGKTIVALYAMLVCVAHGYQAVLMAPTEILARQHADTLAGIATSRAASTCACSSAAYRERTGDRRSPKSPPARSTWSSARTRSCKRTCELRRLGLVVIDEQHKFGVRQRAALRKANDSPHYLVMTATPIPRTISMTLFGDLDLSTLRDMPPGRQPVSTYLVEPETQARWWHFVREKLREGRQAYVVVPLVDESENIAAASVAAAFERLTNGELAEFRVGIVHGRMTPRRKASRRWPTFAAAVRRCSSRPVIEVGVDVPNACVMVIDSPQRFGLAQLHQLRGRVGRGAFPGYCGVLVEDEMSDQARARLEAFAATNDGFELAELDFTLRGPGDLFGTEQHGIPPLRIADLQRDAAIVEEARAAAEKLFATDAGLASPDHARLRRQMLVRYGQALELSDVG